MRSEAAASFEPRHIRRLAFSPSVRRAKYEKFSFSCSALRRASKARSSAASSAWLCARRSDLPAVNFFPAWPLEEASTGRRAPGDARRDRQRFSNAKVGAVRSRAEPCARSPGRAAGSTEASRDDDADRVRARRESEKLGARGSVSGTFAFAGTKVGAWRATRKSGFRPRDVLRAEPSEDADRERTAAAGRAEADRVREEPREAAARAVWNFGLRGTVSSFGGDRERAPTRGDGSGPPVRPPETPNPTGRALNFGWGGSALAERERMRILENFGSCGTVTDGLKPRALSAPSSLRNEELKRAAVRKEEVERESSSVLVSDMDCTERFAASARRLSDRERVRNFGDRGWVSGAEERCCGQRPRSAGSVSASR